MSNEGESAAIQVPQQSQSSAEQPAQAQPVQPSPPPEPEPNTEQPVWLTKSLDFSEHVGEAIKGNPSPISPEPPSEEES